MQIILDQESLNALSHTARREIAYLIAGKDSRMPNEVPDGPFELTPTFSRSFMKNLSEKSRVVLQFFASNEGRATLDELLEETGGQNIHDVKGVFSGLTKRIRRLDPNEDSEAYIVDWDAESEEYFISKPTLNTLKDHFDIS